MHSMIGFDEKKMLVVQAHIILTPHRLGYV